MLWSGLAVLVVLVIAGVGWIFSLPPAPEPRTMPPIAQAETDAMLAALKPPKRTRPLIAIVGINDGSESTDYLMPYGILRRADVADVVALAGAPGPVTLYPAALKVEPQATIAEFDATHPDGADYVIVPAMARNDDPAILDWLKSQSAKGAMIIGVCAGALVVGEAGLLDGKRATTHWYYLDALLEKHPTIHYVADRRMVIDGNVATTTGITASMPLSLTLIEAIAGRAKAEAVARELGVRAWDARHDSAVFTFTRPFALTAIANKLPAWEHESLGMHLAPGLDEVALALVSDAWSRTFRSRAITFAVTGDAVETRDGIRLLPDRTAASWPTERLLASIGTRKPAAALEEALSAIAKRYGANTADFVAMQLEYPKESQASVMSDTSTH